MAARLCSKMSSTSCSRPFARRTSALISSNFFLANAVQMESRHGERERSWKIVAQATKVGGNEQGQPDGIQPLVCSVESRVSFLGQIKHETGLVDLDPVHPCILQQLQYFFINRK